MPSTVVIDPLFSAQRQFRRRDFDACIAQCTTLLTANPYDQAAWLLKCRALTARGYIDDVEWDDEGIAEVLLDENAVAQAPRPGTSLKRPGTSMSYGRGGNGTSSMTGLDAAIRPMTASGRPVTGFARPGTSMMMMRPGTSSSGNKSSMIDAAFRGTRPGTSRVMTSLGRAVRLGTASLASAPGGAFIAADRLDLRKYASRPALGKALCDYLLYVDHDPRRAMELAALATVAQGYGDWWWKERLGKCYFQLGLLRDAESQFASALRSADTVASFLQLAAVYLRLDQPTAALDVYRRGSESFPGDVSLVLAAARVYDTMGNTESASAMFRKALVIDASCVEAIACLASHAFYADQPEVALKYYRRLLQMGAVGVELWTNLGLATFYASQYDLSLSCLERAVIASSESSGGAGGGVNGDSNNSSNSNTKTITLASAAAAIAKAKQNNGNNNNNSANNEEAIVGGDVWYNVGCVAIGLGDTAGLAYQAFKVALALDPNHAESHVNVGVLEARKGNAAAASAHYGSAQRIAPWLYEAWYNGALVAYKSGDLQTAYVQCKRALEAFPEHGDSAELLKVLQGQFVKA